MRALRAMASSWLLLAPVAAAGPVPAKEDAVLDAMSVEMKRNLGKLRQDEFGPPYFLAYRLVDGRRWEATAQQGALYSETEEDSRTAYVEARFGDRAFDNVDLSYHGFYGPASRDPEALKQSFWLLTADAYRGALSAYLEKKAKTATEFESDELDDFTAEKPVVAVEPAPPPRDERERLRPLLERLSRVFRSYPDAHDAQVSVTWTWSRRFLVTSEGTRLATPFENAPHEIRAWAVTRAEDGMRLDSSAYLALDSFDAPGLEARAEAEVRRVAEEVTRLRRAPVQEAAAAPAILDPEMTGVLFHEALGHKLEGQRQRDPRESQLFRDQVGKPILPAFLSVSDDPTMESWGGTRLHGSYRYDSEGVPARRVSLVERGVLREFLMSRWPVKGFDRSNGHGRADARTHPTGRMGNLVVEAHDPVPVAELERRLRAELARTGKPYGFLLVGSSGGENPTNRESPQTLEVRPRLTYRVDRDGRRTLVRGVKLVGTPLVLLNRIVAAGDDAALANGFHCGAESGWVPVSQIAPSVLVSEVELQRLPEDRARPPVVPHPFR
ncbi:MAG: TldD/PmbA family protein [Elusimicrobiota bacterium]|nr:TldD/PmbA family protein [Elusimicrobiota bacterium]